MDDELKRCPSCGGAAKLVDGVGMERVVVCQNAECLMVGPRPDYAGARWNEIPRRLGLVAKLCEPEGMSDGELIARAIDNGFKGLAMALNRDAITKDMVDSMAIADGIVTSELDRRMANREKENVQ